MNHQILVLPKHFRAMDFTLALLQRLVKDMSQNMEQAVEESYDLTIKPWHGWISCAAFKVLFYVSVMIINREEYEL